MHFLETCTYVICFFPTSEISICIYIVSLTWLQTKDTTWNMENTAQAARRTSNRKNELYGGGDTGTQIGRALLPHRYSGARRVADVGGAWVVSRIKHKIGWFRQRSSNKLQLRYSVQVTQASPLDLWYVDTWSDTYIYIIDRYITLTASVSIKDTNYSPSQRERQQQRHGIHAPREHGVITPPITHHHMVVIIGMLLYELLFIFFFWSWFVLSRIYHHHHHHQQQQQQQQHLKNITHCSTNEDDDDDVVQHQQQQQQQ